MTSRPCSESNLNMNSHEEIVRTIDLLNKFENEMFCNINIDLRARRRKRIDSEMLNRFYIDYYNNIKPTVLAIIELPNNE